MKAKHLEENLYVVYERATRFIQIVEYDALRSRLLNLQGELEARRGELVALKEAVAAARIPASVEELSQSRLDWLHTIARDSDTIRKQVDEIVSEYELAKRMWSAIERVTQDSEAIKR